MISLPVLVADPQKNSVFPTSISNAFYYNNGYFQSATLEPGVGYWLKFSSAQSVEMYGNGITCDTIQLVEGWNMIGTVSDSVLISAIVQDPPDIVVSQYFSFNNGYVPASGKLAPLQAYWVKAGSGGGSIILSAEAFGKSVGEEKNPLKSFNSITITDRTGSSQTLYFGSMQEGNTTVGQYAMPPAPPVGVLDARFTSQQYAEVYPQTFEKAVSYPVTIQNAVYPVTVSWSITDASKNFRIDGMTETSGFGKTMSGKGSLVLQNPPTAITLAVTGERSTPTEYALSENYPNPFNPSTTIDVALPAQSNISLRVFNILGEQVAQLASGVLEEGRYSFTWYGTTDAGVPVSTGVYFYKLETSSLNNGQHHMFTHKMLLVK